MKSYVFAYVLRGRIREKGYIVEDLSDGSLKVGKA
jgi:hypothetical protein